MLPTFIYVYKEVSKCRFDGSILPHFPILPYFLMLAERKQMMLIDTVCW